MGWPDGYDRVVLDAVDSTNAEALRRADTMAGPVWIMARRQSAGRGRRGRAWAMPEGNLAATLVMRVDRAPAEMALRSFVAALALQDAVVSVGVSEDQLALKWPNDVLLSGGKLAGILLEASGAHMAVGIGVNLAGAPDVAALEPGAVRPVSLKSDAGLVVTPEAFLEALAAAWEVRDAAFRTFGFAPVRAAWMDRAARLGEVVTARTATQEIRGTFEAVDAGGNLVLLTPKGRASIPAADVYF